MVDYKKYIRGNKKELLNFKGNLMSTASGKTVKSIMVTSAMNGEGKTTAALSLAYTLAVNAKDRVYLVDCSWNAPTMDKVFNFKELPGILDYFLDEISLEKVVRQTQMSNLSLIPFGRNAASSMEILKPELLKDKIAELKSSCDYIIFDSAAIMGSADMAVLSAFFDGVILVIECEKTKWQVVELAKRKLEDAGANIIGVVLNKRKFYIPRRLYG
ncbi:MAG: CpsD/CapB family tyrosine-protein kinase [Candidatus Magnetominusculus sp. LBB02]|nr:CpsD/CapB family tyrosine-protein kinase [Candidatus Magnetominusculus sp. LBB02]